MTSLAWITTKINELGRPQAFLRSICARGPKLAHGIRLDGLSPTDVRSSCSRCPNRLSDERSGNRAGYVSLSVFSTDVQVTDRARSTRERGRSHFPLREPIG